MAYLDRVPLLLPLVLALGCGDQEEDPPWVTETDTMGLETGSSTGGTGPGAATGSTGLDVPCDPSLLAMVCSGHGDAATCRATGVPDCGGLEYSCAWVREVPVALADGACSFGEVEQRCQLSGVDLDATCAPPTDACNQAISLLTDQGELRILTDVCVAPESTLGDHICKVAADGTIAGGPPECTCLCDPELPV